MSAFLWILSGTALVGATILLWGRYEYLKQKRIGEELDRERAELEQKLIEEEKERVRLEKIRAEVKPPVVPVEQMVPNLFKSVHVSPKKEEPVEIVYPMSRTQAAPTMKPTTNPAPRRTTTSVSSTPKAKSTPKTTARSTSRRDDDDYNNSIVLGSTWGSYNNNNDSDTCSRNSDYTPYSPSSDGGSGSDSGGSWGCD
ncbi:hypothetical protein HOBO_247 [Bacillus phage Hobo]|uniref:Uncharacterized protein n=2 Tax=Caeruleovirus BM15 TaxID=1985178 RepID=A0A0S2MUU9_9CAUD|nr:hypothetical protein FD732_gp094 [Bacillus phage BM15]ALO79655.1 hypothetical protein BM10_251 [Bacillus phage BM15]AXQ67002.1 hypothetical protein HOBO_247 [Bacillus phage Hobo]